jgi:L-threonylcarbamoyladenylate synthase
MILDGGPCRVGIESTVVSFLEAAPELLRPGAVPLEDIEALVGAVAVPAAGKQSLAPGRATRHYAPRVPVRLIDSPADIAREERRGAALLTLAPIGDVAGFACVETLSSTGELHEAAANLFATLHRLDASGCERVFAVRIPEHGLGRAIMDRLRRAAAR